MPNWKVGDRVTRERRMDDGTWDREGDDCLAGSPLKHGEVVSVDKDDLQQLLLYRVRWDAPGQHDGQYLGYGLDAERTTD